MLRSCCLLAPKLPLSSQVLASGRPQSETASFPLPTTQPGVSSCSSVQTQPDAAYLPSSHFCCHPLKQPLPISDLESKEHGEHRLRARTQPAPNLRTPTQTSPPGAAAISSTWIQKLLAAWRRPEGLGRLQPGATGRQPGAELICTPLRLGKGLVWGQCNRYLICSSPSGSDGYWNMVMGVV